jgi:hypothetical protein
MSNQRGKVKGSDQIGEKKNPLGESALFSFGASIDEAYSLGSMD